VSTAGLSGGHCVALPDATRSPNHDESGLDLDHAKPEDPQQTVDREKPEYTGHSKIRTSATTCGY
jgi:hypothetical protein